MPDGVVFIPFAYVEAAANLLTNPALDPFGKIPEFKYCAAKLEAIPMQRGGGVIQLRRSRFPSRRLILRRARTPKWRSEGRADPCEMAYVASQSSTAPILRAPLR